MGVHRRFLVVEDADRVGSASVLGDEAAVAPEPRLPLDQWHDVVSGASSSLLGGARQPSPADHDVHCLRLPAWPTRTDAAPLPLAGIGNSSTRDRVSRPLPTGGPDGASIRCTLRP